MNTIENREFYYKKNKFWCHLCKKEFHSNYDNENQSIQCKFCKDYFCELIENNIAHPSEFILFDINNIYQNRRNNIISTSSSTSIESSYESNNLFSDFIMLQRPTYNRPRTTSNLLDLIINIIRDRNSNENMENIISQIMANDINRYGNPPAGKDAIIELKRLEITEENLKYISKDEHEKNSCSVYKELFEITQKVIFFTLQP
jgi:hypothetical protein